MKPDLQCLTIYNAYTQMLYPGVREYREADYSPIVWRESILPRMPDYLNSLDAIMPVVRSLSPILQGKVWDHLDSVHAPYGVTGTGDLMAIATSTAAQWSEAVLRALGKWEE